MNGEEKIKALQDEVEKLHLKLAAICKILKVDLQYNPHNYEAYGVEEGEGE